jgi:hypothetical protein
MRRGGVELTLGIRHPRGLPDLWYPRVRCDVCGELIDGNGHVLWNDTGSPVITDLIFVHQGRCDPDSRRRPADRKRFNSSRALDEFLDQLANNSGRLPVDESATFPTPQEVSR